MNIAGILGQLRRWPDVEAPNLQAYDGADRLLLERAAECLGILLADGAARDSVVVIGDRYGALTLPLLAAGNADADPDRLGTVRVWQDLASGQAALRANAERLDLKGFEQVPPAEDSPGLYGPDLLAGARLVLLRLPKNQADLAEAACAIARYADPGVVVLAAGMVKHMTLSMNGVLAESFGSVQAGLAKGKARVLTVTGALTGPEAEAQGPERRRHADLGLDVIAHGAVFAGTKVDIGTRYLLEFLPQMARAARIVDLGCGSGVLATLAARDQPGATVLATDVSAAAVRSARLTAEANGVGDRVRAVHADALNGFAPASAGLILLNPPFHLGHSVHAGAAHRLFEAAAGILAPGGELWAVWNSHLGYVPALERAVGPTRVMGRNAKFTVTRTVRKQ
ncbi:MULTISPECIES: class I SAM-dependent methyltransferase [Arthrobacter]|uniref:Methyltransferase n=2 Tax=Arthrobacter TaxID=1663 RepID=A0ABU9KH03_9MICC|nr:class I SAM-dependent methyltransferase [Arthrobacter sp. YJM1]MDP5226163.1 methyltransferase [Arthrobacter sp. YJM1]